MSYYSAHGYSEPAWDSEYDSTWEEDDKENDEPRSKKGKTSQQHNRLTRAAKDMQNYRHGYPDDSYKPNLLFYQNQIPFKPYGEYIDVMHNSWCDDYYTLETNHNFIQWLFPLREPGVNWQATPLTLVEIQMMKMDKQVMKRLLESYKLMLGFYGIVLLDENTGQVARARDNWEERFHNLNTHTHNNLRITRILKCLGEMGYERFQAPLVKFFLEEALCNGNLPNVKKSALDYFMFTVKDKKERQRLVHFAWVHYKPQDRFIWGPVEKLQNFHPMPTETNGTCDVTIIEVNMIPYNSEGYSVEDIDVAGEEQERNREGIFSLVRKALGYIVRPLWAFLSLLSRPFLYFFRLLCRPFRCFFTGCFFWFRGERRNQDRFNKEQSEKTEGTKALLLNSPEQENHEEDVKKPDEQSDNSMKESEYGAKLDAGSKCKSVLEGDTDSVHGEPSVTIIGERGNQDGFNKEQSVGTEGTKALLLNSPEQENYEADVRKLDEQSDNSMKESEYGAKLDAGSKCKSVLEGDTNSVHGEPLVTVTGERGIQDGFNEEPRVGTEGTKTENFLLSDNPIQQEHHEPEVKKPDGQSDNSMKESEYGAKLDARSKYKNVLEGDTDSVHGEPLVTVTGERGNQDGFNEEPSVGTEGTKAKNSLLSDNPIQQEHHETEVKKPDGQSENYKKK